VVILDEHGRLQRVVVANDVGRAINPRLCAEQMEGGVHMGLGYALSEDFPSTGGIPSALGLRSMRVVQAKNMPDVDVILIEVPDEVGYGAKGVGEIGMCRRRRRCCRRSDRKSKVKGQRSKARS
jgi:xanthine dehydrogenase molybdenum-binding subunit